MNKVDGEHKRCRTTLLTSFNHFSPHTPPVHLHRANGAVHQSTHVPLVWDLGLLGKAREAKERLFQGDVKHLRLG